MNKITMNKITKKILTILLLVTIIAVACVSLVSCKDKKKQPQVDPIDDNYRVFYQIFVGSFSDSNGDGIGDLRGIINHFDYLNDGDINSGESLGVQGIWLSPIFTSPTYHKYDCTDYYEIDKKFGTMDDLKELIELCHSRNVKIILDLVLNHTSLENEWFQKFILARAAEQTDNPYYDFYSTSKTNGWANYQKITYECNFDSGMPELNYDSDLVRQTMLDVAKYYLDMGIDGFRFDAIKYIYYNEIQKNVDFWEWYMSELRKIKPDIYTVGECWSVDSEVDYYYGALNCFNFTTSGAEGYIASGVKNGRINFFTNYLANYLKSIKSKRDDAMYMPFLANHDMDRSAGYLPVSLGDAYMAANVYLLCSGSPTIYYGEEIGMKGTRAGSNTDANRRLAMLWGDGDTVSDPVGSTFDASKQINGTVKDQLKEKNSLLNYYAKVIALRNKYPEIARGDYEVIKSDNAYLGGFVISYNNSVIGLIHNTDRSETISIPLPEGFSQIADYIGLGNCSIKNGVLEVGPQTSVIIK